MHEAPLFLGLTRPPKIFGLPIGYFVSLMLASVIPFVAANDWRFLLIGVVGYPVLWVVADRNPNLFETVAVVFSRTPRTKFRSAFGGDAHVS
jgi:type IV secretion system protein VirB3